MPELVPIRYGRMLASPFAFYRGGALIMAADLARTPRSGLRVQLCGDAHLSNFGVFGSPERKPRLRHQRLRRDAARPVGMGCKAAGSELRDRPDARTGSATRSAERSCSARVRAYSEAMSTFAEMRNLDVWYSHLDGRAGSAEFSAGVDPKRLKRAEARSRRPARRTACTPSRSSRTWWTGAADHQRPAADRPDRGARPDGRPSVRRSAADHAPHSRLPAHARDRPPPPARAVRVRPSRPQGRRGGQRRHPGLDRAPPRRRRQDPLFLQVKEAQPSVLEQFVGRSEYSNCGQRVVAGQRLIGGQRHLPRLATHDRPGRPSVTSTSASSRTGRARSPSRRCARRRRRLRQGVRLDARPRPCPSGDRIAIAGYLGGADAFDRAIADFAETYADQNERDYRALEDAVQEGRVVAQTGLRPPATDGRTARTGFVPCDRSQRPPMKSPFAGRF